MSFFHWRASADMCTVAWKPSLALMMPIDRPRLPVEPTATLYWLKKCRASSLASTR
ncbi:hypothetical protein D9M71_794920 [compost metagenome]